ncbi:cell division cycle 123 family protein [Endozoicomonas gorgoniicola]|uniref:Cell division cycle 123 family protein n=1 Tax=Endozoicomonas gorgoniicola TaxID=1234144 RepID=A0ABT3MWP4_9GAMM|nr:cell division cycle 123 family protein [Endozoicomonas gorgoniicola]MCW7553483.1 cell division cycle 123 family protein [Endozoicomonas gorgoniicola]
MLKSGLYLQKTAYFINAMIMLWCSTLSAQQIVPGQNAYHDPALNNEKLYNLPDFNTAPLTQKKHNSYLPSFIETTPSIGKNQTYLIPGTTKVITIDWLHPFSSKEKFTETKSSEIESTPSEKIITSTGYIYIGETSDSKSFSPPMQSYYVKSGKSSRDQEFLMQLQTSLELYPAPSVSHVYSSSLPLNKLAGEQTAIENKLAEIISVTTSPLSSSETSDATATGIRLATGINASAASNYRVYPTSVSVLTTEELHKTALITQEPQSLHKVNEEDPDRENYNSRNHWAEGKPEDYDRIIEACNTEYWVHLKGVKGRDYKQYRLGSQLMEQMTAAANNFQLLKRLPGSYLEFINEKEEMREIWKSKKQDGNVKQYGDVQLDEDLKEGEWFVRTSLNSLKETRPITIGDEELANGNRIYKSAREIYLSMPTADIKKHTPIVPIGYDGLKGKLDKDIYLYLFPWKKLNPDKEFRVFVHHDRVTAISQQYLYQRNELLMNLPLEERQAQVETWARQIIEYVDNTVVPSITHISSYSIDLAITETDDADDEIYFIEINPFGKEYASGSALFHWIKDEEILYGQQQENTVHFRYTIESDM